MTETTQREDRETLRALGFEDDEIKSLGLWLPAEGPPSALAEAYIRRSKRSEDLATLKGHLRAVVRWAHTEGVAIRRVWFEQLSASKRSVYRAQFEGATKAVLDGLSKTFAVWKTDRLDRRGMAVVGRLLDEFDRRNARLCSVTEGLDSSRGGRLVFAILSERARDEAKDISLRVRTGHQDHKLINNRGTGVPPFGIQVQPADRTKVEPCPEEFKAARLMADSLLGNSSAAETAHLLNLRSYRTRKGNFWTAAGVSRVAQSPLFAGLVPYRERVLDEFGGFTDRWTGYGEALYDEKGEARRCGTGVVTPAEWQKIRSLIGARTRATGGLAEYAAERKAGRGKPGPKYLGTGIYTCGRPRNLALCGGTMNHTGNSYRCMTHEQSGNTACLGCSVSDVKIDAEVGLAWVAHVSALEPEDPVLMTIGRRWLAFSDPAVALEREAVQLALTEAQGRVQGLEDDYYVYGKMTEERYGDLAARQREIIESLSVKAASLATASNDISALIDNADILYETWRDAPLTEKRMLLRSTLGPAGVIVAPSRGRGYHRDPIGDRLTYDWISA